MLNIHSLDLYILYFLNEKEILNISRTSKYLNRLVTKNNEIIIKHILKNKYNVKMYKYKKSISLLRNNKNLSTNKKLDDLSKILKFIK